MILTRALLNAFISNFKLELNPEQKAILHFWYYTENPYIPWSLKDFALGIEQVKGISFTGCDLPHTPPQFLYTSRDSNYFTMWNQMCPIWFKELPLKKSLSRIPNWDASDDEKPYESLFK
jgi:hypothetical protein